MECWKCDNGKDFESKKSLRMHQISSNHYDKESFDQEFEERKASDESETEDVSDVSEDVDQNESDSNSEGSEAGSGDSVKLNDPNGGMDSSDLDDLLEDSDSSSSDDVDIDSSSGSDSERVGLDSAINNGWGRLATIDLDPEDDETSNVRKNLQGLAKDVGLGENVKWYYEEELKGDTDDPKKAVMGSILLATVMTLTVRPELAQKISRELKNKKASSSSSENSETSSEEDDE